MPPRSASAEPRPPRVVIDAVRPTVDCGALPAKAAAGQPLEVSADLVCDGHDLVMGDVLVRPAGSAGWSAPAAMTLHAVGLDRYAALVVCDALGPWEFLVRALPDAYGSWVRDLLRRHEAGQELDVELQAGAAMADERVGGPSARAEDALPAVDRRGLGALAGQLRDSGLPVEARVTAAADPAALALMRRTAPWNTAAVAGPLALTVDRERATFSAWYELFPRSAGAEPPRSGTLRRAEAELPRVAAMGFDIVYLPPIHPIGITFRKGPNNTLEAGADDPGSPWAIGAADGGHDAVHPDLGTVADFEHFAAACREHGMEVAIDFAVQCSPDHPWVQEHPTWFRHRADGTIRYAENPPKRYQDIYPIDFDTVDREELDRALIDLVRLWIARGVHVFRVDNPHTKAFAFWERLIREIRADHPDVIFLAEAFTRPRVMERLAKVGFTQSYTYFTWRNTVGEMWEYLAELAHTPQVDWFRPNFWPNTPDILHEFLQHGGPAAFRLRAVLAALASPSWGVYSGYELCENVAVRPGSEEYLDSEKYQLRPRDWEQPGSIAPLLTRLNGIRHDHRAAIAQLRTLRLHPVEGEQLLCFSRMDDARRDVLVVVVNMDPFAAHDGTVVLDLESLGIPMDAAYEVHDELGGNTYTWIGPRNYVRLDPAYAPAHVLHLRLR